MKNNFSDLFAKARHDVTGQVNKTSIKQSTVFADSAKNNLRKGISESFDIANTDEIGHTSMEGYATDSLPALYSDVKNELRALFQKYSPVNENIGCHPNFTHLKNSRELVGGYSVTMFFDISGSTKLGRMYSPDIVFNIKNTIIKYVIEIIQAFDGHVHRIMGDAVMAFFRDEEKVNVRREIDSAIDAINASVYILEFMKQVITPVLGDIGAERPVGVRVGIDYAKHDEIVWGNYGASGAFEITATSYFVDIAAKLQQTAKTNKVMIGHNLKELLGFGNEYLSILTKEKKDEYGRKIDKQYPYVRPNYVVRGAATNYRQYELKNDEYFKLLPYGLSETRISVELHVSKNNITSINRCPCSISLDKGASLDFRVRFTHPVTENLTLESEKTNTGPDAASHGETKPVLRSSNMEYFGGCYHGVIHESTKYHGLHHMKIKVVNNNHQVLDETVFSIYIM
ncbi:MULTISPECIES: adenylate/guanylate cyclase domain-containing protein [Enterobacteriaceae]|nr:MULTISPECIES: adenylate/guanylate cyclase domain-containing protein [Enterobacteriaceae]MDM3391498.1 adenylate/guanylate cyclase domain-containing protein [Citrobacter sp. Cb013]